MGGGPFWVIILVAPMAVLQPSVEEFLPPSLFADPLSQVRPICIEQIAVGLVLDRNIAFKEPIYSFISVHLIISLLIITA
jgi:hypothetical protein